MILRARTHRELNFALHYSILHYYIALYYSNNVPDIGQIKKGQGQFDWIGKIPRSEVI